MFISLINGVVATAIIVNIFMLTLWGMARIRQGMLLRLLASMAHRGQPIEEGLLELSRRPGNAGEGDLSGRVATRMNAGIPLGEALRAAKVLDPLQALALSSPRGSPATGFGLSQQGSLTTAAILKKLAEHASRIERRVLTAQASAVYPIMCGGFMLAGSLFIFILIAPRFQAMFKELGFSGASGFDWAILMYAMIPAAALMLWGFALLSMQGFALTSWLWWNVPFFREHIRMGEEARFSRTLALLLASGHTLEDAIAMIVSSGSAGMLRKRLRHVEAGLHSGARSSEAFRASGGWREEVLWAVSAIESGTPPLLAFEQTADVLEEKAQSRFIRIHRVCTPIMVLVAANTVGVLVWTIFSTFVALEKGFLP